MTWGSSTNRPVRAWRSISAASSAAWRSTRRSCVLGLAWRLAVQGTPYEGCFDAATYTGNMRDCLRAAGWQVLPSNTTLEPGDILLNNLHHTAIYIGNNQIVEAFGDEKGGIGQGAQSGDQTGREIWIRPMYTYSAGWDHVLRLPDSSGTLDDPPAEAPLPSFGICRIPIISRGDVSPATCAAQAALNYHGYGWLEPDGVYGPATESAIIRFQKNNALDADGVCGPSTWAKLLTWRS